MPFSIDRVVPWGRSAPEYQAMFALDEADLGGRILGCGDGPASFNAEMSAQGRAVVSVDPLYAVSAALHTATRRGYFRRRDGPDAPTCPSTTAHSTSRCPPICSSCTASSSIWPSTSRPLEEMLPVAAGGQDLPAPPDRGDAVSACGGSRRRLRIARRRRNGRAGGVRVSAGRESNAAAATPPGSREVRPNHRGILDYGHSAWPHGPNLAFTAPWSCRQLLAARGRRPSSCDASSTSRRPGAAGSASACRLPRTSPRTRATGRSIERCPHWNA